MEHYCIFDILLLNSKKHVEHSVLNDSTGLELDDATTNNNNNKNLRDVLEERWLVHLGSYSAGVLIYYQGSKL